MFLDFDVGMKNSKTFADELLKVISKRRHIDSDPLDKAELKEIWEVISDDRYDTRLQTFFDM